MESPFDFDQFPYRQLTIPVPRRDFLFALMKEINGTTNAAGQKPVFRMADLGKLPIDQVMKLKPALFAGIEFQQNPDYVVAKAPRHKDFTQLCPRGSAAHILLQLFNSHQTLKEISINLSQRTTMEPPLAMEYTRGFFLFLIETGFAYPTDGMPDEA